MAKKKKEKRSFPKQGISKEALLAQMKTMRKDDAQWHIGRTFSLVYHPGNEIANMVKEAYNLFFSENALNPTAFPSLKQMEVEVVSMVADLFHGQEDTSGTMTSGGTESILLAVKTARDWAAEHRPHITAPEIIVPLSAHPAFQKAFHYFGIKGVVVPVSDDYRVDMKEVWRNINRNTIMLVGSAPSYPHGVIDPIEELAEFALKNDLLLHVDACVGGFLLPFAQKLGYAIPKWDFAVEGVTSISADVHKYGYAAKGASVIIYRDKLIRRKQFFVYTDWPGGIYASPGIGGTRPGGAIAAAWAALMGIGENGYLQLTKKTLTTTDKLKTAIAVMPELHLIAPPDMSILAIGSNSLDIYKVGDEMSVKGWFLDRQQYPACLHLTVSPIHAEVADQFIADLQEAVETAKQLSWNKVSSNIQVGAVKGLKRILPEKTFKKLQSFAGNAGGGIGSKRTAAMYGMMGVLAGSGDLEELVLNVMDQLYSE